MRLPEEQEERGMSAPVRTTVVAVSALILIILACVYFSNQNRNKSPRPKAAATPSPTEAAREDIEFAKGQEDIETLYKEHKLRAEDLDFWDRYDDKNGLIIEPRKTPSFTDGDASGGDSSDDASSSSSASSSSAAASSSSSPSSASSSSPSTSPSSSSSSASPSSSALLSASPSAEPTDEELAADGRHILITYKDGTKKWLEIDEKLPVNDYDFTKLKTTNGKMVYYEGNKMLSRLGAELSEDSGSVDFEALRSAGVDFVMLKVGSRGYGTGVISLDKNFTANLEAAKKAGLAVGAYFCSQAVTAQEATEEAKFVTDNLTAADITYPVAFRMDSITNDTARTDILDEEQKTQVAEAFLNSVEREGYDVILYGSRDFLLSEILTSELLKKYDVWLTDQNPLPDYPYQYKMWEYSEGETLMGVEKKVSYTISFVDYSKR